MHMQHHEYQWDNRMVVIVSTIETNSTHNKTKQINKKTNPEICLTIASPFN